MEKNPVYLPDPMANAMMNKRIVAIKGINLGLILGLILILEIAISLSPPCSQSFESFFCESLFFYEILLIELGKPLGRRSL